MKAFTRILVLFMLALALVPACVAENQPEVSVIDESGITAVSPDQIELVFNVKYTAADRAKLAVVPFSKEDLIAARNQNFVLVAGYPITLAEMHAAKTFINEDYDEFIRYLTEPLAKEPVGVRWFLIRKGLLSWSEHAPYAEQSALVPHGEQIPPTRDIVFATLALYLTTGERMLGNRMASSSDLSPAYGRTFVGLSGNKVFIDFEPNDEGHLGMGVLTTIEP